MGNTVSLCMIVKNESKNIGRIIDTACPLIEQMVVVDTGSTDGTLDLLKEKSEKFPNLEIHNFEWVDDFAAARNFSFSKATQEWQWWIDGDDSFSADELVYFKNNVLDNPGVDVWLLDYIYSRLPDGKPQLTLGRERFLRRRLNRKWVGAIHEAINIDGQRQQTYENFKIIHLRSELGKPFDFARNIRILEKEHEKKPNDARTAYYYGKELFGSIDERGIGILEKFLGLPGRSWDDEINAREMLARNYLAKKRHGDALRVVSEIYHLDGTRNRAGFYWTYGAVEQDLGNYKVAIDWYQRCLTKPPPPPRVLHLEYYTWNPLWKISECYYCLNDWAKALEYARKAEDYLPTEASLKSWIAEIKSTTPSPRSPASKVIAVEVGSSYRPDSIRFDKLNFDDLPFGDASLSGMLLGNEDLQCTPEVERVVKPGGFLWTKAAILSKKFGYLGVASYGKTGPKLHNYIRVDESKPRLRFSAGDMNFGPYRIRINLLEKSAKKNGYPIEENCDILISHNLTAERASNSVKVLDICEKLQDYRQFGVEKADVLVACSELLKKHLESLFPTKTVIHLDDHFELPSEGWL